MPDKTQAAGDKCLACGLPAARMNLCERWDCPYLMQRPDQQEKLPGMSPISERDRELVREMFGDQFCEKMGAIAAALAELSAAARAEGRQDGGGQYVHNQGAVEEVLRELARDPA